MTEKYCKKYMSSDQKYTINIQEVLEGGVVSFSYNNSSDTLYDYRGLCWLVNDGSLNIQLTVWDRPTEFKYCVVENWAGYICEDRGMILSGRQVSTGKRGGQTIDEIKSLGEITLSPVVTLRANDNELHIKSGCTFWIGYQGSDTKTFRMNNNSLHTEYNQPCDSFTLGGNYGKFIKLKGTQDATVNITAGDIQTKYGTITVSTSGDALNGCSEVSD